MNVVLGFLTLFGANAQCAAPAVQGATGCQSCASCTTPSCYQSCCAGVPTPAPPVKRATCANYDCGHDWQHTAYKGSCPGGVCHKEMCCVPMEDCAHKTCPGGWHKKLNAQCKDACQLEDCCIEEHTCKSHVCARGTRIHAAYPCPAEGCSDHLCCDDIIDVNCRDFFNHKKCKRHWTQLPPDTRCRHETCTHDECCKPEKPPDCSNVHCPGIMIRLKADRLCGKWQCGVEDCCHQPRPCEKVKCPMFYKKKNIGTCWEEGAGQLFSGKFFKDCHWRDCCEPEPTCVDWNCGPNAINNLGVCHGTCNFQHCCETTSTTTCTACTPPPQTCNTCGCR